jgi:hypothetical protein
VKFFAFYEKAYLSRKDENAKEKKGFVLSKFRAFVINPPGFSALGGSGELR